MKIQAPTRLKEVASIQRADFSDQQIQVIRTRLLPRIEALCGATAERPMAYIGNARLAASFFSNPKFFGPSASERTTMGSTAERAVVACVLVHQVLTAIASRKSEAQRAANLGRVLMRMRKENPDVYRWLGKFRLENLMNIMKLSARKLQSAGKQLSPAGQEFVKEVTTHPDFVNLSKSWLWICKEIDRTFKETVETNKLTVFKDTGRSDGTGFRDGKKVKPGVSRFNELDKAVGAALPGWTREQEVKYEHVRFIWYIDPEGVRSIGVDVLYQEGAFSLVPRYRMTPSGTWYSWARLGVDGGEVGFEAGTPVQAAIEECLEKINTARDKRLATEQEGVLYDFGPFKQKMLPADFQKIVGRLKGGDTWTKAPPGNGFGVYTVFTTQRGGVSGWRLNSGQAGNASSTLIDAVGEAVYWYKEERD